MARHRLAMSLRAALVLLAMLPSGCLVSQLAHYERDDMSAVGTRPPLSRSRFHEVTFGTPERPWDGSPAFTLVLPDGRKIASAELTPAFVRSLPESSEGGAWRGWGPHVVGIVAEPYAFALLGDRVVAIRAYAYRHDGSKVAFTPVLGDASGKHMVRFPLSYDELTRLVGKPERLTHSTQDLL